MATPINTYDSPTNLNLGQVPTSIDNEELYRDLLDIHNALEILLTSTEGINFSSPPITGDYPVQPTDNLIRVDASGGDVIITLPTTASGLGLSYSIKRIDTVTANKVTIVGSEVGLVVELIDGRVGGINLSSKSSYTVKAHNDGYDII